MLKHKPEMPNNNGENMINRKGVAKNLPTIPVLKQNTPYNPDSPSTVTARDMWNAGLAAGESQTRVSDIPTASIYQGNRYDSTLPGTDYEEMHAQQQGAGEKWFNATTKMVGTAGTTFVSGTAGLVYGIGSALVNQKLSKVIDNDITRGMDDIMKGMEDALPNYYTNKENNAEWYSPDNILTANFWSDKILKNLGFSLGALAGGVAWGSVFRTIGMTNRLVRLGQGMETAQAVETAVATAPNISKYSVFQKALKGVADKALKAPAAAVLKNSERILVSVMSTSGEATIEALEGMNTFRDNAIEDFKVDNGRMPNSEEMEEINKLSDRVGLYVWGMNGLILSATNYIQLPKILGSSMKADKALINGIRKNATTDLWEKEASSTMVGKFLGGTRHAGRLLFAPIEAVEEGMQYAAQEGVAEYFNRVRDNQADTVDFISTVSETMQSVFTHGLGETFSTKEGLESMLIGALSGGIQQSGVIGTYKNKQGKTRVGIGKSGNIGEYGLTGTGGIRGENTSKAVEALNSRKIDQVLKDGMNYMSIGIGSQSARQEAILHGDKLSEKNAETDFALSYLIPRIKYGKLDSVVEELKGYQTLAMADFESLKTAGIANQNEKKEAFIARIDNLLKMSESMDKMYTMLNDRFENEVDENGNILYQEGVIDKMVYTASKIEDFDKRIIGLSNELLPAMVDTQSIVDLVEKGEVPTEGFLAAIVAKASVKITEEEKFKEDLVDFTELLLLRSKFSQEYKDIRKTPLKYAPVSTKDLTVDEEGNETPVETVSIKTKKGDQAIETGTEYYLFTTISKSEKGHNVYGFPKLVVVKENEDGTVRIRDGKGERDVSKEEFASYDLYKTSDIAKTKKGLFFKENINTVFTFNFGKNKGGKVNGRLKYSKKEGALIFEYKRHGKVKSIEVYAKQFVADKTKGYSQAMITPLGKLTIAQQKSLEDLQKEKDERFEEKANKRLNIIGELLEELVSRQELTNNLITQKKASIKRTQKEIDELKKEANKHKGVKIPFKKAGRVALKAVSRLSKDVIQTERELKSLEADLIDIELTRTQLNDVVNNVQNYSYNTKEFVYQLKEEKEELLAMRDETVSQISMLKKLIKELKAALDVARDLLKGFVETLGKTYPTIPTQDIFGEDLILTEDYLDDIDNAALLDNMLLEEQNSKELIEQVTDEEITPKVAKLEKLQEKLDDAETTLREIEVGVATKQAILDKFQEVYEVYKEEKAAAVEQENLGVVIDQLEEVTSTDIQTSEATSSPQADQRKEDEKVVTSTVAPSKGIGEYAARAQRFGNIYNKLVEEHIFKGRIVTFFTENELIKGVTSEMFPGASKEELEDMVVLVVTDEYGTPVDEFGEPIAKEEDYLSQGIYQAFPNKSLKNTYGSMFREETDDTAHLTKQYQEWRANVLKQKELGPLHEIGASFGLMEYFTYIEEGVEKRDYDKRSTVQEAGLVDNTDLVTRHSVTVAVSSDRKSNGSVSFTDVLGHVFLTLPGGLVKLYNRVFSVEEAENIFNVVVQVAKHVREDGNAKEAWTFKLFDWLQSTIYWGLARDANGKRRAPSNNSIWFQRVYEDGAYVQKLFIGKEGKSYYFTPGSLMADKDEIISQLSSMYNNTQHVLTTLERYNTEYTEIIGLDEEGAPITRVWPNYQSYLLSDKTPDEDMNLTGSRSKESIPLQTNVRPKEGEDDYNRKGIYFSLLDTGDTYTKPETQTEKVTKTETTTDTEGNTTSTTEKSDGYSLNGKTKNSMEFANLGTVNFRLNLEKAAAILNSHGLEVFKDAGTFRAFVKDLLNKKAFSAAISKETANKYIEAKLAKDEQDARIIASEKVIYELSSALLSEATKDDVLPEADPTPAEKTEPVPEGPAPAEPKKPTPVAPSKIYNLDGKTEDFYAVGEIGYVEFIIDKEVIKEALIEDAASLTDPMKRSSFIAKVLSNRTLILLPDEGVAAAFKKAFKGDTVESTLFRIADNVLNDIVPQVEAEIEAEKVDVEGPEGTENPEEPIADPEPEVKVDPIEETPSEETPTEETSAEEFFGNRKKKRKKKPRKPLYRIKSKTQFKALRQERWDNLTGWLQSNFPNVPVYRVKNVIQATNGRQAWGMFKDGAIYVYKNAEAGTAYHEVFEAVWAMFTDVAEKKAIIKEFRARTGSFVDRETGNNVKYSSASNHQVKEELAEEFREHVLYQESPAKKSLLRRLFDDMVKFFKEFITGNTANDNAKKLFDKIGNGFYREYNPYESALSLANKGIIDIENASGDENSEYRIADLPAVQEHELMQHMTYVALSKLNEDDKSLFALNDNLNSTELYDEIYEDILGSEEYDGIIDDKFEDLKHSLTEGDIDETLFKKKVNALMRLAEVVEDNWVDIVHEHKKVLKTYEVTFSEEELNDIVELESNDGKGEAYGSSNKLDSFKNASTAIKLLFATLPDTETIEGETDAKLSSIGGYTFVGAAKVYMTLMKELHTSKDIEEMMLRLKNLAKKDINYRTIYNRLTKNPNGDGINPKMNQDGVNLLAGFWSTVKKQNPDVLTVFVLSSGEVMVGDTNLTNGAKQTKYELTQKIINIIQENKSPYFTLNNGLYSATSKLKNLKLDTSNFKNLTTFLSEVGITMDPVKLNVLLRKKVDRDMFIEGVENLVKNLGNLKDVLYLTSDTLDTEKRLLQISSIKSILDNPDFESTYFSIKQERTQTYIGHNYPSNLHDALSFAKNKIEQLKDTAFSYLTTDVFTKGNASLVMNKLFEPMSGKRRENTQDIMKPVYTEGIINNMNLDKTPSARLKYRQRLLQEIALNLQGVYSNLVPGDAELEWGIRLHNKKDPFVNNSGLEKDRYLRIFKNYFIAEMRMAKESNRLVAASRNSKHLRFFKDIFENDKGLHELVIASKKAPADVYTEYQSRIDASINNFINQEVEDTEALFTEYGLVNETSDSYLTTLPFEGHSESMIEHNEVKTLELKKSVMKVELKKLALNYIISNIELHKMLYSDPFQYKDELKRIKNFNSPRESILHSSPSINATLDSAYNDGYKEGDLGWTDMTKEVFRTIAIGDVWSMHDLPGYSDVKNGEGYEETDGGGVIAYKAYRVFRIRASNWSHKEEAQYRHDIAYEELSKKVDNAKTKKAKEKAQATLDEHEKSNPGVKSAYTPIKPIVAGNKANGREYNDIILDKYALFPLSYRLLHKMNSKSNALKLIDKMSKDKVDYGVYVSGRKVGVEKSYELYDKNGAFNSNDILSEDERLAEKNNAVDNTVPMMVTNVSFSTMALQTPVPSKDTNTVTQGSQITKMSTMDTMDAGIPVDFMPEGVTADDFEGRFAAWHALKTEEEKDAASPLYVEIKYNQELLEERIEDGYNNLLRKVGLRSTKDGFIVSNKEKLIATLEDEILKREVNNNLKDAFDGYREGNVILEATPIYQQIRNILYSVADKSVVSLKVTGGLKVQVPSSLLESDDRIKSTIVTNKRGTTTYYHSDVLKFYKKGETVNGVVQETSSMEVMLGRWFKSDKTDAELLDWLNNTEEGQKQLSLLAGAGFRTPTQKQNSIDAFVIKEFLPKEYGDSIILPSAIVRKSGSDFDIDKFSVYLKNVIVGKDGFPRMINLMTAKNSSAEDRYVKWIYSKADKGVLRSIRDISKEEFASLREDLKKVIDEGVAKFKSGKATSKAAQYKAFSDYIKEETAPRQKETNALMKDLFFKGGEIFKTAPPHIKRAILDLKKELADNDVNGVIEIERYLTLVVGLIEQYKGGLEVIVLEQLKENYEHELRILGATRKDINEFVKGALGIFRESKQTAFEALLEELRDVKGNAFDTYSIQRNALRLDTAKKIAEEDGLHTFEEFKELPILSQNISEAVENEFIQSTENLIKHNLNFDNLIKPNSAEDLKELTKKINKKKGKADITFTSPGFMLSRRNMSGLRRDFIQGKRGIATAATSQTNNSQNQRSLITVDPNRLDNVEIPERDKGWLGDGIVKFSRFNSMLIEGKKAAVLSMSRNKAGKLISDIIGMFIDGYVDISAGPWIMQMGATPETAGTWLFLIKIGVPMEDVAYFMNQPIILALLKEVDVTGDSMYKKLLLEYVEDQFSSDSTTEVESIPGTNKLFDMIGVETLSQTQNKQQLFILKEFLKYSKMADHLFLVQQGSNMDTATLNDSLLVFKKQEQLKEARKTIISSVDNVLESSFIKKLNEAVKNVRDAYSKILISDTNEGPNSVRSILENVLRPYTQRDDRSFVRISQRVVSDFFDWALQSNTNMQATMGKILLGTESEKSAARQIIDLKDSVFGNRDLNIPENPSHDLYDNQFLKAIILLPGDNRKGKKKADNIQVIGRDNKVYDQNQLINSFEEIRTYLTLTDNLELYGKLVRLAIMQSGLTNSRISYTQLLPYRDFKDVYNDTLSSLSSMEGLDDFFRLNVFERNQWNDKKVVPTITRKMTQSMTRPNHWYSRMETSVPNSLKAAMRNNVTPKIVAISPGRDTSDVIVFKWSDRITKAQRLERARTGDTSHVHRMLMRKVYKTSDRKEALTIGKEYKKFIYVGINAWGDSFRAQELLKEYSVSKNGVPQKVVPYSIFDNGFEKLGEFDENGALVSPFEVSDDTVLDILYNAPAGPVTVETKKESSVPAKPTSINVFHSKGDNTSLSNLALRPFKYKGLEYKTVEHAYQTLKSGKFNQAVYLRATDFIGRKRNAPEGVSTAISVRLMKDLVKASFLDPRNADNLKTLRETVGSNITHLGGQDKFWEAEFPKILLQVRNELSLGNDTKNQAPKTPEKTMKLRDGNTYTYAEINTTMLLAMGYSERYAGQLKKKTC